MANALGGAVESIVCASPTYGNLQFDPFQESEFNFEKEGIITKASTAVLGSGRRMQSMQKMGAAAEGDIMFYQGGPQDTLAVLALLSGEPGGQTWTFIMLGSGVVYKIQNGMPVDVQKGNAMTGHITLKIEGQTLQEL